MHLSGVVCSFVLGYVGGVQYSPSEVNAIGWKVCGGWMSKCITSEMGYHLVECSVFVVM